MFSVSMLVSNRTVDVPTDAASTMFSTAAAMAVVASSSSVIPPSADSVTLPVRASRPADSWIPSPAVISITLPAFAATRTVSLTTTLPALELSSTVEPALDTTAVLIPPSPSSTVRSPTAVMLRLSTLAAPTS